MNTSAAKLPAHQVVAPGAPTPGGSETAGTTQTPEPQATAPTSPAFTMLSASDNVCVDGFCALPQSPSQP